MNAPTKSTAFFLALLVAGAAWSAIIGAHELLGHGGHCALDPNCMWIYADAMYFDGDYADGVVNNWQIAAGSLVAIAFAVIAALVLWYGRPQGFAGYVFLWALAAAGLIQSGAYIAFGWLIHPGMDWAQLVEKAGGGPVPKTAVTVGGVLLILAGVWIARRLMPGAEVRGGTLTGLPLVLATYLGFSVTALAASWFVPAEDRLFMLYGGLGSGTLFMFWFLFAALPGRGVAPPVKIGNAWATALVPAVVIFAYVFVLGRGIDF